MERETVPDRASVILLDAVALIDLLVEGPRAPAVAELIEGGDASITSVTAAEVVDVSLLRLGVDPETAGATLDPLLRFALPVLNVGWREARIGGELRARRYHGARAPLSLADCLLMASAAWRGATTATSDAVLAQVAAAEGVPIRRLWDQHPPGPAAG